MEWERNGNSKYLYLLISATLLLSCTEEKTVVAPQIDNQPPTVSWLSPQGGSTVSGEVYLILEVTDNESEVDSVKLFLDGEFVVLFIPPAELRGDDSEGLLRHFVPRNDKISFSTGGAEDGTISYIWDTTEDSDGVHIWEARAWDEAGNIGISSSLVVSVNNRTEPSEDRIPPDVWWISPDPGSTLKDTITLSLGYFDENGVDSVKLFLDGEFVVLFTPPLIPPAELGGDDSEGLRSHFVPRNDVASFTTGEAEDGTISYLWDTTTDSDGVHIWEARAWDETGNSEKSLSLLVRVQNHEPPVEDRTPPVISWLSPTPGDTLEGTALLRFQVFDESFTDSASIFVQGNELQKLVNIGSFCIGEVNWITSGYDDGIYLVQVKAWDSSLNVGWSESIVFRVWNNRPRVIWVPDDYEKIQDAINASQDGDTVRVRAGEYHEQLQFFDKNVSLVSESGPEETILDGLGYYTPIWVTGGQDTTMIIRGFTLRNNSDFLCYCAIFDGGTTPKIVNNIFISDGNDNQRGIWMGQNATIIRNNLFIDLGTAIEIGHSWGDVSNNMILHMRVYAIFNRANNGQLLNPNYNLVWQYSQLLGGAEMNWDNNNIVDLEPIFMEGSYHLSLNSPGVNSGRLDLSDQDGSRSDIGVYGGPYAYY